MAERPPTLQANSTSTGPGDDETHEVDTVVFALIPEFQQVKVRDCEGHLYALTPKTSGVDLLALHEGQRIICMVTRKFPRVLSAQAAS
jgi:hypothetical protein